MDRTLSLLVKFAALDKLTAPLRTMSGGAKKTARELIETRKEVLGLEKAAGNVAAFKTQAAAIAKTYEEMDTARRRIRNLKLEIASADGPTGRLTRSLEAAENKVAKLSKALPQQSERLSQLKGKLRDAGIDADKLAQAEDRLARSLAAANAKLDQQREKEAKLHAQAARVDRAKAVGSNIRSAGVRGLAIGAATAAPGILASNQARDFDSVIADIGINTGIADKQLASLRANLLKTAPIVGQLPSKLAESVATLAGLGIDPRAAAALSAPIGKIATAWKADTNDIAKAAFANYTNLKIPLVQATEAMDAFAYAGQKGGFELNAMSSFLPSLSGRLQSLGQSGVKTAADLGAALQVAFADTGNSDEAANNIQNVLDKINTKETIANFAKLGIDLPKALKKAYAEGRTPLEEIAALTTKATGGDLSKISNLFGDVQAQAGVRSLIQHRDEYLKIREGALKASGLSDRVFAARTKNDPALRQARFNASLQRFQIVIGTRILPYVSALLERGGMVLDWISDWADRNPALANGLALVGTGLGAMLGVISALAIPLGIIWPFLVRLGPAARFVGAAFGPVGAILRVVGTALFWVLGAFAALIGVPVWAAAAIVAGVALIGLAIYNHWSSIKTAFNTGVASLKGMIPSFRSIGAMMLEGLLSMLSPVRLIRHIWNMGVAAIGAFKKVLGIQSPSRVFAELGGHMMGGLHQGLDTGVAAPLARIRSAGRDLTRAMAVGVTSASLASSPVAASGGVSGRAAEAPRSIHIGQIVIKQQPGEDAVALARRVREEIKKLEAGERRSSFQDDA